MATQMEIERSRHLLQRLLVILDREGESNWRRGIRAALAELTDPNGTTNSSGFGSASSIFKSITSGGGGFSEYYIVGADGKVPADRNRELDELRSDLWNIFDK